MGVHIMNLKSALATIGHAFALDPLELDMAAREDPHGGYHSAYDDGFPVGSMWRVEGQFLYALIRALKPLSVLELGTSHGCSATHILQSLSDNGIGTMDCVDNGSQVGVIGDMIPDYLRERVSIHPTSLENMINSVLDMEATYDVIFEDAMHTIEQVDYVWAMAGGILNPGGMIISHDAAHVLVGADVQKGIARAGYADRALTVLIEPADCGFAVWRKPL
jgi:predicted O-methyltransferase YrrM